MFVAWAAAREAAEERKGLRQFWRRKPPTASERHGTRGSIRCASSSYAAHMNIASISTQSDLLIHGGWSVRAPEKPKRVGRTPRVDTARVQALRTCTPIVAAMASYALSPGPTQHGSSERLGRLAPYYTLHHAHHWRRLPNFGQP